jgi:hypothetical protein
MPWEGGICGRWSCWGGGPLYFQITIRTTGRNYEIIPDEAMKKMMNRKLVHIR